MNTLIDTALAIEMSAFEACGPVLWRPGGAPGRRAGRRRGAGA